MRLNFQVLQVQCEIKSPNKKIGVLTEAIKMRGMIEAIWEEF